MSDERVDLCANNNYAIQFASYYGHEKVVKLLLSDERIDPSAHNNSAIQYASHKKGNEKVVELLLSDERVREKWKN